MPSQPGWLYKGEEIERNEKQREESNRTTHRKAQQYLQLTSTVIIEDQVKKYAHLAYLCR